MAHIDNAAITPKQAMKRQYIVDTALEVLGRDGLAGCTERAIAAAGPVAKSAVHYYFRDTDEIIDLAMAEHLEDVVEELWQVAGKHDDPAVKLWAVVERALRIFVGPTSAARGRVRGQRDYAELLWFEYWLSVSRRGTQESMQWTLRQLHDLFGKLLADTAVMSGADPQTSGKAAAMCAWLLGTIVQQGIAPRPAEALRAEALSYLE